MPALDGIRGVAILLVLAVHTLAQLADSPIRARFFAWARVGWLGVDVFFVLSGLLITGILLDGRDTPGALRRFYARRALRIWPLYLLVVSILTAIAYRTTWVDATERAGFRDAAPWLWTHTVNWYFAQPLPAYKNPLGISPFWSLAIEEQFYVVWPFALLATPRAWTGRLCLAVAAASFAVRTGMLLGGVSPGVTFNMTLTRLDGLALGGWVAVASRDGHRSAWLRGLAAPLAHAPRRVTLAFAVLMVVCLVLDPTMGPGAVAVQLVALPAGAALAAWTIVAAIHAPADSPFARAFTARPLRWTGRISYGLYLLHAPILYLVDEVNARHGYALPRGAQYAAAVALTVAVATLSWRYWEQPWLRLRPGTAASAGSAGETSARVA